MRQRIQQGRNGQLHRLTRDHTYVQMLVDSGLMSKEEAATSTSKHILINAVGGSNEEVHVDVERVPLANGDRVLLCSDGLTDCLSRLLDCPPKSEAPSILDITRANEG